MDSDASDGPADPAATDDAAGEDAAAGTAGDTDAVGPDDAEDTDEGGADEGEAGAQPRIDSVLGTTEDELVLVSEAPDAFEGIEDLAEGLDDLGVDRIIVAGSNARGALLESSAAALAIGFELTLVRDGIDDPGDWVAELEAAGAVVKSGADVWLKM